MRGTVKYRPAPRPSDVSSPTAAPPQPPATDPRARLVAGMAAAIPELGYAALRVDDVVRYARTSKRTFYAHFDGKEACLLALYESESDRLLEEVAAAIAAAPPSADAAERVAAGVGVYFAALQTSPGLVRTVLVEILHAGPRGLAVRRRVIGRFADLWARELTRAGAPAARDPALARSVATAVVGGVNELVLEAVEEDRVDRLAELGPAVAALVRGLMPAARREALRVPTTHPTR